MKNRAPMEIPEIKGDGLHMAQRMNMFASKNPPDNTIKRIEELEKQMKDLMGRPVGGSGLDADAMDKLNDLLRRVQALETRADKTDNKLKGHEDQLSDHERRIKALEAMDFSGPANVSGDIDTAAILKQVNLVRTELNQVRNDQNAFQTKVTNDLEALRLEMRAYTDKEVSEVKAFAKKQIQDAMESLKYELDRLRAEFETFKSKDFRDLEARVTALEKKLRSLQDAFNNLQIPASSGNNGVSQEAFNALQQRVADLEDALNHLRNEFAKWMKEM